MSPERNIAETEENNTRIGEDIKGEEAKIRSGKHFAQEQSVLRQG